MCRKTLTCSTSTVKPPTYDLFGTVKKRSVNGGGLYWEVGLFLARPKACSELIQDNTQKLKREYVMPNIITCHWIKIQCIKKEMKFVIKKKIETMIMMKMMIKLKVKVIFTLRLNTCHNDFLMLDCVFLSSRAKRKDSSVIFIYFVEVQSKIAFCVLVSPQRSETIINPCIGSSVPLRSHRSFYRER